MNNNDEHSVILTVRNIKFATLALSVLAQFELEFHSTAAKCNFALFFNENHYFGLRSLLELRLSKNFQLSCFQKPNSQI